MRKKGNLFTVETAKGELVDHIDILWYYHDEIMLDSPSPIMDDNSTTELKSFYYFIPMLMTVFNRIHLLQVQVVLSRVQLNTEEK